MNRTPQNWSFSLGRQLADRKTYYRPAGVTTTIPTTVLRITGAPRNLSFSEYKNVKYWSRIPVGNDAIPLRFVGTDEHAINQVSNALVELLDDTSAESANLIDLLASELGGIDVLRKIILDPTDRRTLAINLLKNSIAFNSEVFDNPNHPNYKYFAQEKNEVESQVDHILSKEEKQESS